MSRVNPIYILLVCLVIAGCANAPPAGREPVFLSAQLSIEWMLKEPVAGQGRQALKHQLSAEWATAVSVGEDGKRQVGNCMQFLEADDAGLEPTRPSEYRPYRQMGVACQAVAWALELEPAAHSEIDPFELNRALPAKLPAEMAVIVSSKERKRVLAGDKGGSWADINPVEDVRQSGPRQAVYIDKDGASQTLTVLARGDWNGDNVEDLILQRQVSLKGGSYSSVGLVVLTRQPNEKRYELLALFPEIKNAD